MKFLHSMIRVRNIEESLRFYTKLFNMKLVEQRRLDDCTLYFLNDESETVQIELTYNDETPPNGYETGNAFGHFAFHCDDMEKFTKALKELGYEYLYEPFDLTGKGSKIAFVKDPDGNEIELIEKVVW